METISPDHQVIVSTPPPLAAPFNLSINSTTHQHILPPIKSLPSWSRTRFSLPKPGDPVVSKNILKSTARRVVPITKTSVLSEQCTQTSAQSSRQSSSSSLSLCKKTPPRTSGSNRTTDLKSLYEKKIVFLQSSHGEVLGHLQEEVEQLKLENKGLQFNLVMTKGDLDKFSKSLSNSQRTDGDSSELRLLRQVQSLEKELINVKTELSLAKDHNKELIEIVQQSQNKEIRPKSSIKLTSKKSLKKSATTSRVPNQYKKISPRGSYQAFECDTNENERVLTERSCQIESFTLPNIHNRRKMSGRNNKNNINKKSRDKDEPITLPVLQPFPHSNNNYSLRCKRAKAIQMQNKRSHKDLSLSLLSKQNFMTQ